MRLVDKEIMPSLTPALRATTLYVVNAIIVLVSNFVLSAQPVQAREFRLNLRRFLVHLFRS